jgi:hypothetical protein
MKALQAHAEEANKEAGSDPAKKKTAGVFKKGLDDIVAKVKKFETT